MTIEQAVINQAKRTDLAALVQAKGIQLKKNGKSLMGLCPFHADKNPSLSITPSKNLFRCFGCGAAGDAIRFIELFDQVDFAEAVARLSADGERLPATMKKPYRKADRPSPWTLRTKSCWPGWWAFTGTALTPTAVGIWGRPLYFIFNLFNSINLYR